MKLPFIALILNVLISLTAFAGQTDYSEIENALGRTLNADVRVTLVRASYNPASAFFNLLDNQKIKTIKFIVDGHHAVKCDLIYMPEYGFGRLEFCRSKSLAIDDLRFEL